MYKARNPNEAPHWQRHWQHAAPWAAWTGKRHLFAYLLKKKNRERKVDDSDVPGLATVATLR